MVCINWKHGAPDAVASTVKDRGGSLRSTLAVARIQQSPVEWPAPEQ